MRSDCCVGDVAHALIANPSDHAINLTLPPKAAVQPCSVGTCPRSTAFTPLALRLRFWASPLWKFLGSGFPVPLFVGLGLYLSLDEQLSKLSTLRLALERHCRLMPCPAAARTRNARPGRVLEHIVRSHCVDPSQIHTSKVSPGQNSTSPTPVL
jgi:hypothetical protein